MTSTLVISYDYKNDSKYIGAYIQFSHILVITRGLLSVIIYDSTLTHAR